jgi:hypothetical protein
MSVEHELFFGLSSDRLRRRCRWAGVILALSFAIPYEHVDGVPQFLWQILGELPPAAIIAAFSTSAAGAAILLASLRARRASTLALVAVASLVAAWLLERLGADRAAWDVLPLPDSLTDRPLSLLLGLSLTGAGMNLGFKPHTRRAARIVLVLATLSIAGFYLWPARGEAPITTIVRVLLDLPLLPGFRYVLGAGMVLLVITFPALVAVLGVFSALSPPSNEPRLVSRLVTFGLPGLLGFFVFRSLLLSFGDSSLPATIGGVALLAALLGLLAAAVEVLVEVSVLRGQEPGETAASGRPALPKLVRAAAGAAGTLAILAPLQWWLARPPLKGIDWKLAPPSPAADEVFGKTLGDWSRIRLSWDDRVREASSATAMVELKAAERAVKQGGASFEPSIQAALSALLLESRDLDLAGRRWFRLVADLNEANRAASMPYYVDPSVSMYQTPDGLRRRFGVQGFRIERVRAVRIGSERFATLHVRRLGKGGHRHGLLGFSRDQQPFALVVLDEIEKTEQELAPIADASPPSCSGENPALALGLPAFGSDTAVFGALELEKAMLDCGRAIADLVAKNRAALVPALAALTERHELQHQSDGPHLPLTSAVLERMGGYDKNAQELVNRELSAYIAELTTAAASPKLGLVGLLRFTRSGPRTALHHISVLAVEALTARRLTNPLGGTEPSELAKSFGELFAEDDAALRQRAARAWKALYDDELPDVLPD